MILVVEVRGRRAEDDVGSCLPDDPDELLADALRIEEVLVLFSEPDVPAAERLSDRGRLARTTGCECRWIDRGRRPLVAVGQAHDGEVLKIPSLQVPKNCSECPDLHIVLVCTHGHESHRLSSPVSRTAMTPRRDDPYLRSDLDRRRSPS
jgi:hypothetical protein